jgi:hypothetical protein
MDRALFEAVREKSLSQWSHRTIVRNKSDHLLTGLLVTMPVIVDSHPRHQSWSPLSLLSVRTSSAWGGEDRVGRIRYGETWSILNPTCIFHVRPTIAVLCSPRGGVA